MEVHKIGESPGYLIESLSRNMRRFSARQLRENRVGLTLEQIAVLTILEEQGPRFQNELAEIMSKDNPTLTRILDILEKKSYLKRSHSPDDRRKFLIVLTENGSKILAGILPIVRQIRRTLFHNLSQDHVDQLLELKGLIESNISNYADS